MVKITKHEDLVNIRDDLIFPYIKSLLYAIQNNYNYRPDQSIEPIGAIFYLEQDSDIQNHSDMGLSIPLNEERFEFIEEIQRGYCNGWILIDNEKIINLIGKKEIFNTITGENYEYY